MSEDNDESRTGTRMSQLLESKKRTFILLNAEHNSEILPFLDGNSAIRFPYARIVTIFHKDTHSLPFHIVNELNKETIEGFVEGSVCKHKNSFIYSFSSALAHRNQLTALEEELIWRFIQTKNILLADESIERWMACYGEVMDARKVSIKIRQNSTMEHEAISRIGDR